MRLTLLRHAKSSWSDEHLTDVDRPLSARGERDAPEMAERLAQRGQRPTLILSSNARRALDTANVFARRLDIPDDHLVVEPRLYLATPGELLAIIAGQDDARSHLMVVGHNPGLTALANLLLPDLALHNLPTTGVLTMEVATTSWTDIGAEPCRLVYHDWPKKARTGVPSRE